MATTVSEMGRPKKKEKTKPMRLPESVVVRIGRLAAHHQQDPGDYAATLLAGPLNEAEGKMLKEIEQARKASKEDKS